MNLLLNQKLAENYNSLSQKIRVLTEDWVYRSIFCPNCGCMEVAKYNNNRPVADFYCKTCKEQFELKSKKDLLGSKIIDGAYSTMIERLNSYNNPNFFLLTYNIKNFSVIDFLVIPKHFFVPRIIEKRKPLTENAKRAGWVGCNIILQSIPEIGKIYFIKNSQAESSKSILKEWKKTLFLREEDPLVKGWLLDIMRVIEKINKQSFALDDIYRYEKQLSRLYPENKHIKDKIRQQLQILRDKNYLDFVSRGHYRLNK